MSATIDHLKIIAVRYSELTGTPIKTLSSRIFDDGKRLDAIVAGAADVTTARFDIALRWFSANWPGGEPWPDGVMRPDPAGGAEEAGGA
jgi:hypothetical protein